MKTNKRKMGVLRFLAVHSDGLRRWFLLGVFATLVSVAASFLMPQVVRFLVDSVLGDDPSTLPAFAQEWLYSLGFTGDIPGSLYSCALGVIVLMGISGIFNFVSRMGSATYTERFSRRLRDNLYAHVQYLPFKWHVGVQTGEIIQRCTGDLDAVREFASQQLLEVVRTFLLVAVALALMFSMNLTLTLVSLIFIPLIILYTVIFYRIVGSRFLKADEAEGELTTVVQENLTGVRVVRAFGRERYELDRFNDYNERFAGLWIRLGHTLGYYWGVGDIATGLQILSVVVAGTVLAANGDISLGELLVFVTYNQQLAWPIRALGRTLSEMSKAGVSARRIQEILDAEEEPAEPNAQKPPLNVPIRFENVTFSYEQQPVLKDLSFTIPPGTTFGILGATGSGKSTITYLLNRLYDLPEGFGTLYYGDVDVREIDRQYLRRNVGLVLQEPFLFSRTIEENIAITSYPSSVPTSEAGWDNKNGRAVLDPVSSEGNWDADAVIAPDGRETVDFLRSRIRHTAVVAAVDEAISEFSRGYGTVVGERGVTLSGGQKQRVAIARTLMLDAPVMVFDDSMSAVDLETDAKIREALRRDKGDATVILISHRINTLMQADRIMVLEDGHIAALGTHAELIHRPGLYKRIYDMQSESAEEGLVEVPAEDACLDPPAAPAKGGEA